jgi:hypothetical protein
MLSVVRPLNQDVATDLLKKSIKSLAGSGEKIEQLGLAVRAFGELSCPHEFLQVMLDFNVVSTLQPKIDDFEAAHTLSFIIGCAAASNAHDWIGAEEKQKLSYDVIGRFHLVSSDTRLCLVKCLVGLNTQIELFSSMLSAEAIRPNIQTYREKLKFLSRLSCPPEIEEDFVVGANLRYLLSTLTVNFSLLWDPIIKIINSYFDNMDQDKSWEIFYSIFHDVNALAVDNETDAESADKPTVGIDFRNYRNLLLRSLDSLVVVVERKNSILSTEFLDVFMKKKIETRDGKGLSAFLGLYKQVMIATSFLLLWCSELEQILCLNI